MGLAVCGPPLGSGAQAARPSYLATPPCPHVPPSPQPSLQCSLQPQRGRRNFPPELMWFKESAYLPAFSHCWQVGVGWGEIGLGSLRGLWRQTVHTVGFKAGWGWEGSLRGSVCRGLCPRGPQPPCLLPTRTAPALPPFYDAGWVFAPLPGQGLPPAACAHTGSLKSFSSRHTQDRNSLWAGT